MKTIWTMSLALAAGLTACKARQDGAQVRDETLDQSEAAPADLNAYLSELAAGLRADYEVAAGPSAARPQDAIALDDERALTPGELDELKAQAAATTALYKKQLALADKADKARSAALERITKKLDAAVNALKTIDARDTERYRQGLADVNRAVTELALANAGDTVAKANPGDAVGGGGGKAPAAGGAGDPGISVSGSVGSTPPAKPQKPPVRDGEFTCVKVGDNYFPRLGNGKTIGRGFTDPTNCDLAVRGRKGDLACGSTQINYVVPHRVSDGVPMSTSLVAFDTVAKCVEAVNNARGGEVCVKVGDTYEIRSIATATKIRDAFTGDAKFSDIFLCPSGAQK